MFGLFDSKEESEARILFGSMEEKREEKQERTNPYSGKVVSSAPLCSEEDARKALEIAQKAAKNAAEAPLSQRIAWLEDVADKLREYQEDFAQIIVDEIAKPLHFARIEVQRCAETIECDLIVTNDKRFAKGKVKHLSMNEALDILKA